MSDEEMPSCEVPVNESAQECPLKTMQTDLHEQGTNLNKAWTNLFSLLSKYQAELIVKENQIEIAEEQLAIRKKELTDINERVAREEESESLREQLNIKEALLSKCQAELAHTSDMYQKTQADLADRIALLDQAQNEQIQIHQKFVQIQSENARLQTELVMKVEESVKKDSLVEKLHNRLIQETTELRSVVSRLKDSLQSKTKLLEVEKKSHNTTKRLLSLQQPSTSEAIDLTSDSPWVSSETDIHDFTVSLSLLSRKEHSQSSNVSGAVAEGSSMGLPVDQDSVFFPLSASTSAHQQKPTFEKPIPNISSKPLGKQKAASFIKCPDAPMRLPSDDIRGVGSKRGQYKHYDQEFKLRVGKYAANHGNYAAMKQFKIGGKPISESTIRQFRKNYVSLVDSGKIDPDLPLTDQVATAIVPKKRGRPQKLRQNIVSHQNTAHESEDDSSVGNP
ncbi:uncharacterized protein LOC135488210 [Lineus longissimus]|uniref:uncharacterized protein LOC135488210 n=1 Tax=Lineus longissimus TaxID=88925 RepID=UPI002B4D14D0